jgi:hypothetical protein
MPSREVIMLVRIQAAQQAQAAPEAAPSTQQSRELRDQIRESIRAAREAAMDARDAQREANQVRVQTGLPAVPPVPPVPAIPSIQIHPGSPADVIPPQAVDVAIGFFIMCAVMIIGWPLARAFGKRIERGGPAAAVSPAVSEQLQRIEHTVEAMAIEVERISEAQRYLAKLHSAPISEPAALDSGERR